MIRRLLDIRFIAYALIALALSVCAVEIGLQVRATRYGCPFSSPEDQLTVASWQTHHQLRPNAVTLVRRPDSAASVEIRTNSFGLRGPEPVLPKPANVYRIICLGDDTVFAGEMDEADTMTQRLQGFLEARTQRKIEVINAGVPGFCPLLSCIQLRTSLAAFHPDLIVLNFDMTDVADDHRYRRTLQTGNNDEPVACAHTTLLTDHQPQCATLLDQFRLTKLAKKYVGDVMTERSVVTNNDIDSPKETWTWIADDPPDWSVYIRHALEPIVHLQHQCNRSGTNFILACSPAPWQISATAGSDELRKTSGIPINARYSNPRPFQLLAAVAEKYHIRFLNPTNAFLEVGDSDRLFLRSNRSFSKYGHALYAHQLAEFIAGQIPGIVPATSGDSQPVFRQATDRREVTRPR